MNREMHPWNPQNSVVLSPIFFKTENSWFQQLIPEVGIADVAVTSDVANKHS